MGPRRLAGVATTAAGVVLLNAPSAISGPTLFRFTHNHGVHILDVVAAVALVIGAVDAVRR